MVVLRPVKRIEPGLDRTVNVRSLRYVKVAPPPVHAGIGKALRSAFAGPAGADPFADLLARLDRA